MRAFYGLFQHRILISALRGWFLPRRIQGKIGHSEGFISPETASDCRGFAITLGMAELPPASHYIFKHVTLLPALKTITFSDA
jgi:hypothetical protein